MSPEKTHRQKLDRTLVGIVLAIIFVAIVNAGISVALATSIQDKYNAERIQQTQQSQVVFTHLCTTLESLHADNPPSGSAINNPSRAYLQELHDRLGELASDLKC
jgi:hypothetical protein